MNVREVISKENLLHLLAYMYTLSRAKQFTTLAHHLVMHDFPSPMTQKDY